MKIMMTPQFVTKMFIPSCLSAMHSSRTSLSWRFVQTFILHTLLSIHGTGAQSNLPCSLTAGCYPSIFDVTTGMTAAGSGSLRTVSASSTCNTAAVGGGEYWSLRTADLNNPYTCSVPSSVQAINMVEAQSGTTMTYWQSGNMVSVQGTPPTPVTVVFNFTDIFSVHLVEVKFEALHMPNPDDTMDAKPAAWSVEKYVAATDSWQPLRHFSKDCGTNFPGIALYDQFSSPADVTQLSCLEYLPAESPFFDVDNWVECNFGQYDTHGDWFKKDPRVLDHYSTSAIRFKIVQAASAFPMQSYVSISTVHLDVQCRCSGHANLCTGPNENVCQCQHNTEGPECTQCMPLYNNQSWALGLPTDANACQECQCNAHANNCTYNAAKTYGVCGACSSNTEGDFCETCVQGYYNNPNVTALTTVTPPGTVINAANGGLEFCLACNCFASGVSPGFESTCDSTTGQCTCKSAVNDRDCSVCKDTFWNLSPTNPNGCQTCNCDARGSVGSINMCDKISGQCLCKQNVQGVRCDTCMPVTFGFSASNPLGCSPCDCDPGAFLSDECSVSGGQCNCRDNTFTGRACRTPSANYYVPKLDFVVLEPESSATMTTVDGAPMDLAANTVLRMGGGQPNATVSGRGFVTLTQANQIAMTFTSPYSGAVNVIVRYEKTGTDNFIYVTGTLTVNAPGQYICGSVTFSKGHAWNLLYSNVQQAHRGGVNVGQVCVQNGGVYNLVLKNPGSPLLIDSVVLIPDISSVTSSIRIPQTEINRCLQEAQSGIQVNRENCTATEYSIMAAVLGKAWLCSCTSGAITGNGCDPYSGDCFCRPGALVPKCTQCEVDAYNFSPTFGCTECGCDATGSAHVSCNATGDCNCLPNVQGTKCNVCAPEHYGLMSGQGCTMCQCDPTFSIDNNCDDTGQCRCKPGVNEMQCGACMNGFFNLTANGCTECACNHHGSTNRSCDVTTGVCECLTRVEGATCDTCKPGFYGLGAWNPEGCIDCFCWNKGQTCSSAIGWYDTAIVSNWLISDPNTPLDIWTAANVEGVSTPVTTPSIFTSAGTQYIMRILSSIPLDPAALTDIYFHATAKYMGDQTPSYARRMMVTFRPRASNYNLPPVNMTNVGDYKDMMMTGEYVNFYVGFNLGTNSVINTDATVQVTLKETNCQKFTALNETTPIGNVTYQELMQLLTKVSGLVIRGFRREAPDVILDLVKVTLDSAVLPTTQVIGQTVNNVGECQCDTGYAGRLCELCAAGYTRADPNNTRPDSTCVPCSCNNHGMTLVKCDPITKICSTDVTGPCDPVTGVCMCKDNTAGDHCETCLPGYHGDATVGTEDDCLPCACPGLVPANETNVFASTCVRGADGTPVCQNCADGHTGNNCEICMDGYFGSPANATINGGQCQPCVCNGRATTCDNVTGECANCTDNTGGINCDICGVGFYGNPAFSPCTPCPCAGQPGGTGLCDDVTGACECLTNVTGPICDTCMDGAYNLVDGVGCTLCDCSVNGSTSDVCDKTTGQCSCEPRVEGRACDQCIANYWNPNHITGCDLCSCNPTGTAQENGATIQTCDVTTGQCTCALPGISGRTCDQCSPVSTYTFEYIQLFQIGSFPNCELCGECFDSWALILEAIGQELAMMGQSLTIIWSNYGNQTAAQVSPILTDIESTINQTETSVANIEVISGQLLDLSNQMAQASSRERLLNSRSAGFSESERSLSLMLNSVKALTQAVQMTGGVVTTLTALQSQLDSLESEGHTSYASGDGIYNRIQTLTFVVASPAERERQIRQQSQRYMVTVSIASDMYNLVEALYNTTLIPGTEENTRDLATQSSLIANATVAVAQVTATAARVLGDISTAQTTVSGMLNNAQSSRDTVLNLVDTLQTYVSNASELRRDAEIYNEQAMTFQTTADTAHQTLYDSMIVILESIASLTQSQTDMVAAQTQSSRVQTIQLGSVVDLETILDQIAASGLSAAEVAALNTEAQSALFQAEDALRDTQAALQVSRGLSEELSLMESDIAESKDLRAQAAGIKMAADSTNQTIYSALTAADTISTTAENHVTTITSRAGELQGNITKASTDFTATQLNVTNAVTSARQLDTRANNAVTAQQNLLDTMGVLNSAMDEANTAASMTTMTQADNEMSDLVTNFSDVTQLVNLETLIQELTNQSGVLTSLEAEIDQLLAQVDALTARLTQGSSTATCNNPV